MKKLYIQPTVAVVRLKMGRTILQESLIQQNSVIDDEEEAWSKSYQGGLNSLGWEDDKE